MKLYELLGVKKFADIDLEDVLKSMSTHEELGRGTFGITLKHSTKPEVVKFWITDSSYDDFIDYIVTHPSKYFPKLYSKPKLLSSFFLRPKDFPEKVKYIRMEKLQPIDRLDNSPAVDAIEDLFIELKDSVDNHQDVDQFVNEYLTEPNVTFNKKYLEVLNNVIDDLPRFCHEMIDMMHYILKGKNKLDIHDENIMLRNGKLVITDPVYNSEDRREADKIRSILHDLKKEHPEAVIGKSKSKSKTEEPR